MGRRSCPFDVGTNDVWFSYNCDFVMEGWQNGGYPQQVNGFPPGNQQNPFQMINPQQFAQHMQGQGFPMGQPPQYGQHPQQQQQSQPPQVLTSQVLGGTRLTQPNANFTGCSGSVTIPYDNGVYSISGCNLSVIVEGSNNQFTISASNCDIKTTNQSNTFNQSQSNVTVNGNRV